MKFTDLTSMYNIKTDTLKRHFQKLGWIYDKKHILHDSNEIIAYCDKRFDKASPEDSCLYQIVDGLKFTCLMFTTRRGIEYLFEVRLNTHEEDKISEFPTYKQTVSLKRAIEERYLHYYIFNKHYLIDMCPDDYEGMLLYKSCPLER